MKVYLLNPPIISRVVRYGRGGRHIGGVARAGTFYYPIFLAYATGVLEEKYKDVRLIDACARSWSMEETLRDAEVFQPDLIIVDSNFASLSNDIKVTELLKQTIGKAKTVLVGPPASQSPARMLRNDGVDVIARLEYDFTLLEVAEAIETGKGFQNIRGISYKTGEKITRNPDREFTSSEQLDRMPFVSKVYKEHLNIKDYFLSNSLYPEVQIFTGRGCPHHCTFCSWPETLMGRKYRVRSIEKLVDEMEYIKQELPQVKEVFLEDDTFTLDRKRIRAFCEEIKRRKLNLVWSCNARADLDYETMRAMKRASCRLIIVGYESGSSEILKNVRKEITIEQIRKFTMEAKKAGLMIQGDFIIGLPGETRETAEQTINLLKELKPNLLQIEVAQAIPGTEFYKWAQKNNFLLSDNVEEGLDLSGGQKCIVSYPEFSNKEIERYVGEALKKYYLSPAYIPVALRNVLRRNGLLELKGMAKSAKVFLKYLRRNKSK